MKWISPRQWYDAFRGTGEAAVTVPPMDGSLKPNTRLDQARSIPHPAVDRIDNLVSEGTGALFSAGPRLYRLRDDQTVTEAAEFGAPITALAATETVLAVASGGKIEFRWTGGDRRSLDADRIPPASCITAMCFTDRETLIVAIGSDRNAPEDWARDLMEMNRTGSLWQVDVPTGKARRIVGGLAWPSGVAALPDGRLLVAEAWRHRLLTCTTGGELSTVVSDLPAYPGRLVRDGDGFHLCLFAPRRQIFEFVLREPAFRDRMLATISPQHWIAPVLRSDGSYLEPVQTAGVRQLGQIKPWAPSRSYGLVVRLDRNVRIRASAHSRADGQRHGITSAAPFGAGLLLTCTGTNELLLLENAETLA